MQPNQLDGVRGSLWRYVMASSGWERAARSVIWDGTQQKWFNRSNIACLNDHSTTLAPVWPNCKNLLANLEPWLGVSMDGHHPLTYFLVQGDGQTDFVPWLLGESYLLHPWAVQACLRNVVAHGALSSTKAQQWGLAHIYDDALVVLPTLLRRLLAATLGSAEVIHG